MRTGSFFFLSFFLFWNSGLARRGSRHGLWLPTGPVVARQHGVDGVCLVVGYCLTKVFGRTDSFNITRKRIDFTTSLRKLNLQILHSRVGMNRADDISLGRELGHVHCKAHFHWVCFMAMVGSKRQAGSSPKSVCRLPCPRWVPLSTYHGVITKREAFLCPRSDHIVCMESKVPDHAGRTAL